MNIGLYFGSFNPVHTGHLIIANHILNEAAIEKLWFIVSPQNPLKKSNTLLNEYDRLHLLQMATKDDLRIKVSDIEFSLPKPSYTYLTLAHITEKYPKDNFSLIMGSDSFQNIKNWKNYETILNNYKILIYNRPGFEIAETPHHDIEIVEAPLLQISATEIRNNIQQGKSIKYIVTEPVLDEIEKCGFYKNISPTKNSLKKDD